MVRKLPPLNALRAFEAAARHLSFLKASEELHVTPGAISQQVRALEEQLGVTLFRRMTRGVLLTDAGQRYGKRIGELLDGLVAATVDLQRDDAAGALTVSTMPSFAARWLIPRLGAFRIAHPSIALRVLAEGDLTDFAVENVDVAIRFGPGRYPGLVSELLFHEEIFPVCSPKLLNSGAPLRRLADLVNQTLLHDEPGAGYHDLNWRNWLEQVGASEIEPPPGPGFTYTHMTLQAAVAGQGVALGTTVLASDDLASGSLIRPLKESVTSSYSYWLVCPPGSLDRPKAKAFHDWVISEGARFIAAEPRAD